MKAICKTCGKMNRRLKGGGLGDDDLVYLSADSHLGAMLGGLQAARDELADCVLQLGERGAEIPIHALVGFINSGHIRGALRSGVKKYADYNGRQVRCIVLPCGPDVMGGQIPEAGVRMLVDFWYTDKLELGEGIAQSADVWCAANYLQAWKGVMDACEAHVSSSLSAATWAEAWTLGNVYNRTGLCEAAIEFASTRFQAVAAHLSWAHAPLEAVKQVFARLQVGDEDFVLQAALSWADSKREGLAELLSLVRLPQVTKSAMDKLKVHPLVSQSAACLELLAEAAEWVSGSEGEAGGRQWGPRAHRSLVVVGEGWAQRYDASTNTWADLPPPPFSRGGVDPVQTCAAAASLSGRVYLAGGYTLNLSSVIFGVKCFDPAAANGAGAWAAVAPMRYARGFARAASLNGLLYVAGGEDPPTHTYGHTYYELYGVERYSPASDTWEAVGRMTVARSRHQLVALGGFLYAIGGIYERVRVATAERYDPATNTWTPIASMASARCDFAAAAMGGFLYVTGGVEGPLAGPGVVMRRCERYDPASNTWSRIADLPEPRYSHALACLDGSLYAMGGQARWRGFASASPQWRYDVSTDTWVVAPLAAGSVGMRGFGERAGWTAL